MAACVGAILWNMSERSDANRYDDFAVAYSEDNKENVWNAYYERPATLALAGDVSGLRVLDAGCGNGPLAAELVDRGAAVTGVDRSARLLEIAAQRLGPAVPLLQADLSEPLPFGDEDFDLIVASLVMHYLEDWVPTLSEFHRLLVSGGRLIISTHHPLMDHRVAGQADYFATYEWTEDWAKGDQVTTMRFWHRPLHAMTDALRQTGYTIDVLSEPLPQGAASRLSPDTFRYLSTHPHFLFFSARRS
jgi:SAM-dependent methyltransferase